MADTYTALLRYRQQTTGANNNVWGGLLNAAVHQLIEDSIAGRVVKVVAGADITLSSNLGSNDEARMAIVVLTGSPGVTRNIIIPNSSKWYIVDNQTNAIQNFKTAAGTAFAVSVGDRKILMCDGADGVFGVADTLGGLDASAFAKLASRNSYTAGNADVPRDLTDAGTVTMDLSTGNVFILPIAGNRTLDITNPIDGSWAELYVTQDATGGRTLAFPSTIVWEGGAEPELLALPNVTEGFAFRYDADTTLYFGRSLGAFAASGGGAVVSTTLAASESNVDIFERAGRPAGAATVTVRISAGTIISSLDASTPALDFAGFVAGSLITIINEGLIAGHGGKGGRGGAAGDGGSANLFFAGTRGSPGGDAIRLPASACTINITNANGRIWGGGGGGGGGGPDHDGDGSNVATTGGGGGGGAGSGQPGDPGSFNDADGTPGLAGGTGLNGDFGTGGTGEDTGGTGDSATGGNGGTWGAAGAGGQARTTHTLISIPGVGGAAGKAINVNGGTAPVFASGSGSPQVKGAVA